MPFYLPGQTFFMFMHTVSDTATYTYNIPEYILYNPSYNSRQQNFVAVAFKADT